VENKLRTVLWGWVGQPLPDGEAETLRMLRRDLNGRLGERLCSLLAPDEVAATIRRVDRLLRSAVFPQPRTGRPAVPWPPI
jgi:hypothetical protein